MGEIGAARGLFSGPWILCVDFNTTRHPSEKKNCRRINKAMSDLSEFIKDMELVDLDLKEEKYTWKKGDSHNSAARLDRILISNEMDDSFRYIKQYVLHTPIMLQCGEWKASKSYFKFKNWWLQTEGFKERVK